MRQWILHGVAGQPDVRQRDDEFTLAPSTTSVHAIATFNATLDETAAIIAVLPHERLLEVTDPQPTGFDRHVAILDAIFKVVGHVQLHAGQIILLTKQFVRHDLDLIMPRKR